MHARTAFKPFLRETPEHWDTDEVFDPHIWVRHTCTIMIPPHICPARACHDRTIMIPPTYAQRALAMTDWVVWLTKIMTSLM
jgi:hypothetical protein